MSDCTCSETSPSLLPEAEIEQHTTRLKALSNEVRLRMVDLIYHGGGEICVCEFEEHFDLSQPTISHHLKVLREAGLIKSRKKGTYVYHRVDESAFTGLARLMNRLSTVRVTEDAERAEATA